MAFVNYAYTGYVILTPCVQFLIPEPDRFLIVANFTVSPEQNSKDQASLKLLLEKKSPKSRYLVGPDTAGLSVYFPRYLYTLYL